MVVADAEISLTITGNGDVLEPHDGLVGEELLYIKVIRKRQPENYVANMNAL